MSEKTNAQHFADYLADGKIEPCLVEGQHLEINGAKYYIFAQSGEFFPQSRILAMQDLMNETTVYNLTAADLTGYIERIIEEAVNVSLCIRTEPKEAVDSSTAIQQIGKVILKRLSMNKAIDKVLNISALWFIAEGEDPGFPHSHMTRAKVADFTSESRHIDFFLRTGNDLLNPLRTPYRDSFPNAIQELNETIGQELEMMEALSLSKYSESSRTSSEPTGFWDLQAATLRNWKDFLDSQPTTSTNS